MALLWNLPHARNTMRTTKEHQHRVGQRDARGDDDKWHALTPFLVAASCTAPSVRHGGVPPSVVDSTSDGVREPCVLVRWRQVGTSQRRRDTTSMAMPMLLPPIQATTS
ncbi:Os02g0688201 [Oryza sativa Japonica Group]|uniref:Os02g0688201 protein n=4 Tax=Oryza TaxID=4527 RepID=Q6ZH02_ORYSJ|nr:hypothetical protein [Oryza sativa Japonica Group]BAS80353.1 Os02g0688201 [Oryza sativa Japonica Group]